MAITPENRTVVQHLLNVSSPYNFDSPDFQLINEGVTDLTEEFNPETEQIQYIAEKDASTIVKRYAPSIAFTSYIVKDDKVNVRIRDIVNTLPVGSATDVDYIRFNLLDVQGETTGTTLKYIAYRRRGTITASNIGGAAGDTTTISATVNGKGDVIKGILTVDKTSPTITTYSFVADTAESATVTFTVTGATAGATLMYGNTKKPIVAEKAEFTVSKGYTALYEAVSGAQHGYGRATAENSTNNVTVTLA